MTHDDSLIADLPHKSSKEKGAAEKLVLVKQLLERLQSDLNKAFQILSESDQEVLRRGTSFFKVASEIGSIKEEAGARVIEGVFDGQNMVGPDGKQYSVPANYASKSKLVEGDILKLTIQPDGRFVYKQIGPRERARIKGVLTKDEKTGEYQVLAEGKKYKIILASITYFKGEPGDDVIILVPKEKNSVWAAVENIVKPTDKIEPEDKAKTLESSTADEIGEIGA